MASKLPRESSSSESGIRIVLLGNTRVDKSELAKLILGSKNLKEEIGLCTLYETEETGRKISVVVDTPGWDSISIEETDVPDVFLLVIPVKQEPSMYEISEAQKHMELLSERVWKHTIVLFDCEEGIEESAINKHKQSAKTILEKCKKRFCVFQRGTSQMTELFKKIDDLMKENYGKSFMQQMYSEKTQPGTQVFGKGDVSHRRESKQMNPPNLKKENETEEKKETVEAAKHGLLDEVALCRTMKPFSVILMGIIGALIGAVAGSEHGALGACAGLVSGIIVGILLAVLTVYICSYIYK